MVNVSSALQPFLSSRSSRMRLFIQPHCSKPPSPPCTTSRMKTHSKASLPLYHASTSHPHDACRKSAKLNRKRGDHREEVHAKQARLITGRGGRTRGAMRIREAGKLCPYRADGAIGTSQPGRLLCRDGPSRQLAVVGFSE